MEVVHWVTGSMGHLGHLSRPGHRVTGSSFWPGVIPEFFRFSKKCPKCKTYIWNAKMTKVIVGCLLLDWNHWKSVLVMNFYFYLWLLKVLWPENTSSHMTRHFEFIIEQVTGSTGSPGRWIPGSLGRWVAKCDPVPSLLFTSSRARNRPHTCQLRWTRSVEDKMHDAAKLFNSFYVAFVTGI